MPVAFETPNHYLKLTAYLALGIGVALIALAASAYAFERRLLRRG